MTDANPFEEIERVFDLVSEQLGTGLSSVPVDVLNADDAFVLWADLPGADPDDVAVRVSDGHEVTVEVTSDRRAERSDGTYVVRERRRGATSRTVTLPSPVAEEEAAASFEAGVLEVTLPKYSADGDEGTEIPVD